MTNGWRWVGAWALVSLAACESSERKPADDGAQTDRDAGGDADQSDGGSDSGVPLEVAGFDTLSADMQKYARSLCELELRCGGPGGAECLNGMQAEYCYPPFDSVVLPDLDKCIAARKQQSCSPRTLSDLNDACMPARLAIRAAQGISTVDEGASCNDSVDTSCNPYLGLFCDAKYGECGVCKKALAQGSACRNDRECGPGLHCGAENTCENKRPKGSACEARTECATDDCIAGTCQDSDDLLGKTCDRAEACGAALACLDGRCALEHQAGEPCKEDGDCTTDYCEDGACSLLAACGTGELGAPCYWNTACAQGLICPAQDAARCEQPLADGEPCTTSDSRCAAGSFCKWSERYDEQEQPTDEGVCAAMSKDGEACASEGWDSACPGLYCNAEQKCGKPPFMCE